MGMAPDCRFQKNNKMLLAFSGMKRILLVEDDPIMLELLSEILQSSGVNVLVASTFEDAREKAVKEHPSAIIVDLFFSTKNSDVQFYLDGIRQELLGETPSVYVSRASKDGFGLSYRLKEDPETGSIPILAIGPMDTPYLRKLAFGAGCDEYLGKPFGMKDLLHKLTGMCQKGGGQ